MDVQKSKNVGQGHSVELGRSTWDPDGERSVRDRWQTAGGGFSPHSSSEVPIGSLKPMLTFVAENDELSVAECAAIIEALAASVGRQQS